MGAIAVLALLGLLAPYVPALALGICAAAVVVGVAVADRLHQADVDTDSHSPEHSKEFAEE
jgi:hypothetical protein